MVRSSGRASMAVMSEGRHYRLCWGWAHHLAVRADPQPCEAGVAWYGRLVGTPALSAAHPLDLAAQMKKARC